MVRLQPKTEEFLNQLLWTAEMLTQPSFRNLTGSYESWAYRNGLLRQVNSLESNAYLERDLAADDRVYRLTYQGRLHALGGRDPEAQWGRDWDDQWRMILFDIPLKRNTERARLRRYLRERGFGLLQNSVWVTPDPLDSEQEILSGGKIDVGSLILLAARPCAGESDEEIVQSSWNFQRINEGYEKADELLDAHPAAPLQSERAASKLQEWAREEHRAWLQAVEIDPLLPDRILPRGYRGRAVWKKRKKVLSRAARQMRDFKHV